MKTTPEHDKRMAKMTFASVYPHYIRKVEGKGRTKEELHQVIKWLTDFDDKKLKDLIEEKVTFETFFKRAKLNCHQQRLCAGRPRALGVRLIPRPREGYEK